MSKSKKVSLSVTGFEPAISRFVAERVIRCATRMSNVIWEWLKIQLTVSASKFLQVTGLFSADFPTFHKTS